MAQHQQQQQTLISSILITYPLEPPSLVDDLRKVFPIVHFYPGLSGTDYVARDVPLAPPEVLESVDALLCFKLPSNIENEDFSVTPNLRLIQCVGSGVTQVTSSAWYKSIPSSQSVILANTAGIHAGPIGEHVLMVSMMLLHKSQMVADFIRGEKRWPVPTELGPGGLFKREIRGLTVGILGYGAIGREVARLSKAFGATVTAGTRSGQKAPYSGYQLEDMGDPNGDIPSKWVSTSDSDAMGEFFSTTDILVNLLPSTPANRNFIGRRELTLMKNSAILVNAGRGDTVDQDALVEALQASSRPNSDDSASNNLQIFGAALDVTVPEPLPDGHALYSLPNCILTPHVSWASLLNFRRACEVLKLNVARMNAGEAPLNVQSGDK